MRSLPRLGLTLLCAALPCGLSAQAPSTAPQAASSSALALAVTSSAQGCPVGLWASRAADGSLVAVDREASKSWEHAYRISFGQTGVQTGAHLDTKTIAQARITLRGLAGPQVLPAGQQPDANATETFTVVPYAAPQHLLVQSVVYAQKITGVQWIELNDLTFTDGSRWHESSTAKCRVAPNGFMLVASGR